MISIGGIGVGRLREALALVVGVCVIVAVSVVGASRVAAADLSKFDPGHIISDEVFFNKSTMTADDIQAFIEGKIPACAVGVTCLRDFRQDTRTILADDTCRGTYLGEAAESAAQIIFKVAQACNINPQVILVTLQKEQGLVTKSAPTASNWRSAMGYACPDTAACDSQYYGFFNQVYSGAWQLIRYGISATFTWFPVGAISNIAYSPLTSCGSSPVYIVNRATAALYYYTPYQPNANALAAGYGASSDQCASYGNRNFYQYFTDWFGSTRSVGPAVIDAAYASSGGAAGLLGAAVTSYIYIADNGGGLVRAYANGAITWTQSLGAAIITGDMRARFNAEGGIAGRLGWPATSAITIDANGGGLVQAFQFGAIAQSPTGGQQILSGAIRTAFNNWGGLAGPFGWPTGPVTCTSSACSQTFMAATITSAPGAVTFSVPAIDAAYAAAGGTSGALGPAASSPALLTANGGGFVRAYTNGAITSSPIAGVHILSGGIRAAFNANGGIGGFLGWPVGDQSCTGTTCSQSFQGGTVYSSPSGSSAISGPISALHESLGGVNGVLGAPVGSTQNLHIGIGGLVQGFDKGAITWTTLSGAVAVTGDIRATYAVVGGIAGTFGWPMTAPILSSANGGGIVQGFERGAITQANGQPAFPISGGMRSAFAAAGGLDGALGWPQTAPNPVLGGTVQAFQNGAIVGTPSGGFFRLDGAIRTAYAATGGIGGSIGWPTTDPTPVSANGGGVVQGFDTAALTWTPSSGAVMLSGPIRAYYNAIGGLAGPLGWPVAAQTCASATSCSQQFQNGFIDWSLATGGSIRKQ